VVRLWRTHLVFVLFATMELTADRLLLRGVAMDSFYEWSGERPPKQPWAVARRDGQEMLVAGLWDGWRAADGSILRSFALITTGANETLRPIHHRMPVIIDPTELEIWLGDDADAAAALMRPAPDDVLRA
jgi:putative SOS response-associated peptidase YedK